MLGDLLIAIDEAGFDEYGELRLESAEWRDLTATLLISATFKDELSGRWRVSCLRVRDFNLSYERQRTKLQLLTEHVLLWPYTRPSVQLYYSGHIANPTAAIGDIWEVHRKLVGTWFAFDRFLNRLPPHMKYLDGGSGLFAQGPVELIGEYASVLRQHGFAVSLLPPTPPVWWDGHDWVAESSPMYVLILGNSFIIAPQFIGERETP